MQPANGQSDIQKGAASSSSNWMIKLDEAFEIPAPASQVWPLLTDPVIVASCIPGASLNTSTANADGKYMGTIRVKFGPTVVMFKGEVRLNYDHERRRCVVVGRGIDQRGASRANSEATIDISGEQTTKGAITGGFTLTGPLEAFARSGGIHIARALLAEFCKNLTALTAQSPQPVAVESSIDSIEPSPQPKMLEAAATRNSEASLSATRILWLSLVSWWRGLFSQSKSRS